MTRIKKKKEKKTKENLMSSCRNNIWLLVYIAILSGSIVRTMILPSSTPN